MGGGGLVDGGLQAVGIGDVAGAGQGAALAVGGVDLGRDLLGVGGIHVEHGHAGAQAGEFMGRGFAEAGASARDQSGLSLNNHVRLSNIKCY